jgi:hypothetical protein
VPLTVNPFISLPTATTLPYTFKSLPSTLPPSVTVDPNGAEKTKYVVSSSGHAAHPDNIIASCQALQAHLKKTQEDAEKTIRDWENDIKERELAEKRRLAPGWLDREEKILEPVKASQTSELGAANLMDSRSDEKNSKRLPVTMTPSREGEELDRVFGGMGLK